MARPAKDKSVPNAAVAAAQAHAQAQAQAAAQAQHQAQVQAQAQAAAVAAKANELGPKVIDVDNFIRVRDSVYARLSTIQDLIKSFSLDYLRQTNLLLGEGTQDVGDFGMGPIPNIAHLMEAAVMPPMPQVQPLMPMAPPPPAVEEKKERKKRTHDPLAPKRPLTPYFLYMQTARPIIAQDLGADAPKGAVQEEGQRRWSTMNPLDKAGWDQAYQYNLRLYNARMHSYKVGGNQEAQGMSDDEALKYAEDFHIPMPTGKGQPDVGNEQDAIAQQLSEVSPQDDIKTPKSTQKGGRKRKTATPGDEADASKAVAASPDKKRKRASKVTEEKEPEPKKSGRKKAKSG